MVSGGGGWGVGGGGGSTPGTNIRPNGPKRTEDTNKLHELGGECLECLGGAVKEFVPLILFFLSSFFSAVSLLQLRRDGRHNRGGPGDVVYMVVLLLNVIVLFTSVSLQQAPSWEGEGSGGAGVRGGWQRGGVMWGRSSENWRLQVGSLRVFMES